MTGPIVSATMVMGLYLEPAIPQTGVDGFKNRVQIVDYRRVQDDWPLRLLGMAFLVASERYQADT